MAFRGPKPGINDIGSFQLSAVPYVTASLLQKGQTLEINFPHVTRFFTVFNQGSPETEVAVGFSVTGTMSGSDAAGSYKGGHYFVVKGGTNYTADIRCANLFLSNSVGEPTTVLGGKQEVQAARTLRINVLAGLTMIDRELMPILTATLNGTASFKGVG